jgi:hypothetical protein
MELCNVAAQQKSTGSYAEVVNFATQPRISTHAEESKQFSADEGFIVVTGKQKNGRAANKVTKFLCTSKKSKTPMVGVWNFYASYHCKESKTCVSICITL